MAVTKDDVRHIAKLAKLAFSEEELERLTRELASILDHIRVLEKAPLEGLEPVAHALDVVCPTREDSAPEPSRGDRADFSLSSPYSPDS